MAWYIESLTNDRLRDAGRRGAIGTGGGSPPFARWEHRDGGLSRTSVARVVSAMAATACTTQRTRSKLPCAKRPSIARAFLPQPKKHPGEIDMRAYVGRPIKPFLDFRGMNTSALHDPNDYSPSQAFAKPLREAGEWGLVYRSVRHEGGECIAAFKPQAVTHSDRRRRARLRLGRRANQQGVREIGGPVRPHASSSKTSDVTIASDVDSVTT